MKKIIIGLVALSSISAFAGTTIEINNPEAKTKSVVAKISAKSVTEIALTNQVIISEPLVELSEPVEIAGNVTDSFTFVSDFESAKLVCFSFGLSFESMRNVFASALPLSARYSGQLRGEKGKWTLEYGDFLFIKTVICSK